MSDYCPYCEFEGVQPVVYVGGFWLIPRHEKGGRVWVDGLRGTFCKRCGEVAINPENAKHNHDRIEAARRLEDRP